MYKCKLYNSVVKLRSKHFEIQTEPEAIQIKFYTTLNSNIHVDPDVVHVFVVVQTYNLADYRIYKLRTVTGF